MATRSSFSTRKNTSTGSLAVETNSVVAAAEGKHLAPCRGLGQPSGGPQGLVAVCVSGNARLGLDAPDLCFGVVAARQQILARVAPVERQDPAAVARQVGDLLAGADVVEGDDARVAGGSEELARGRKGQGAHGVDEAGERVQQAARVVAEDVQGAVLVTRGGEAAVVAEGDAQAEAALCLVLADAREGLGGIEAPDVDCAGDAARGEVLAVGAEGNGPDGARLVVVGDGAVERPLAVVTLRPDLDAAVEAGRGGAAGRGFSRGDEVVDAERVGLVERLDEGEVGLCGVVDVYRRGARGGEQLCRRGREGEDVGCVGVGIVDGVEGEVLLGLWG